MSQNYVYSISSDFHSAAQIDLKALKAQIQEAVDNGSINKVFDDISYDKNTDIDVVTVIFREALPTDEKTSLDDILGLHDGSPLPITATEVVFENGSTDVNGRLEVVHQNRVGVDLTISTHNFCDATTWFTNSVRSEDEVLTTNDGYVYDSTNINWINLVSGHVMAENSYTQRESHGYCSIIYIDGYAATYEGVYDVIGSGDYTINYEDGIITFNEDQSGSAITASYSYATDSVWILKPDEGKQIHIEKAKAQFSDNLDMRTPISFDIYAYNPYDLPNKFLAGQTKYKRLNNFIDEALGNFPMIPPIGGTLGNTRATYGFPFSYSNVRILKSSQGVELRISLINDVEYGGERATATFYCSVLDE